MTFREKKAWISLVILLLVFGSYFPIMVNAYHTPGQSFGYLAHIALIALATFGALEVLALLIVYFKSPEDARTPKDELQLHIELKANRLAYFTLIILSLIATILFIHDEGHNWAWGHVVFAAIVLAEMVNFTTQIVLYRRSR